MICCCFAFYCSQNEVTFFRGHEWPSILSLFQNGRLHICVVRVRVKSIQRMNWIKPFVFHTRTRVWPAAAGPAWLHKPRRRRPWPAAAGATVLAAYGGSRNLPGLRPHTARHDGGQVANQRSEPPQQGPRRQLVFHTKFGRLIANFQKHWQNIKLLCFISHIK